MDAKIIAHEPTGGGGDSLTNSVVVGGWEKKSSTKLGIKGFPMMIVIYPV